MRIALSLFVGYSKWKVRCSTAAVSLSEDAKVECRSVGLKRDTQGVTALDVDLHTTNNFAPNEYRGVVNSSGLAVYKGSTQEIKVQLKVKTETKLRV